MTNLIPDLIAYTIGAATISATHVLAWRIWQQRPPVTYDDRARRWRPTRDIQHERGWTT